MTVVEGHFALNSKGRGEKRENPEQPLFPVATALKSFLLLLAPWVGSLCEGIPQKERHRGPSSPDWPVIHQLASWPATC